MNIDTLTQKQILNVTVRSPEVIFSGKDLPELKRIYRKLSLKWHPDKNSSADSHIVFSHINLLYHSAIEKFNNGTLGRIHNVLNMQNKNGNDATIKFFKERSFEMGKIYLSNGFATWEFDNDSFEQVKQGIKNIGLLSFPDENMRKNFEPSVPKVYKIIENDERSYIVFSKNKDFLCLADILEYYNGKISPTHVAWILRVLYNQICFLHFNEIMHGGICLENVFIDPKTHDGYILGGWWYSCKAGEKLSFLSQAAFDVAPVSLLNSKKADMLLDLEMVKQLGMRLLGHTNGIQLQQDSSIPQPMKDWLRTASLGDSIKDYSFWIDEVVFKSFGKRKFVAMDLSTEVLYKGE